MAFVVVVDDGVVGGCCWWLLLEVVVGDELEWSSANPRPQQLCAKDLAGDIKSNDTGSSRGGSQVFRLGQGTRQQVGATSLAQVEGNADCSLDLHGTQGRYQEQDQGLCDGDEPAANGRGRKLSEVFEDKRGWLKRKRQGEEQQQHGDRQQQEVHPPVCSRRNAAEGVHAVHDGGPGWRRKTGGCTGFFDGKAGTVNAESSLGMTDEVKRALEATKKEVEAMRKVSGSKRSCQGEAMVVPKDDG